MPIFKLSRQVRLGVMCVGTTSYFLVEIIVGHLAGSIALVADSFHMLSDIISMLVAWYAITLAARTARNNQYTYGWQRAEILGALVNGVFLLALCFTIVVEALQRFFEPQTLEDPRLVLIVGGVGLAINLVGLGLFHEHGHTHRNGDTKTTDSIIEASLSPGEISVSTGRLSSNLARDSAATASNSNSSSHMNMRGVFLHVLGDALGSIGVMVSALVNMYCRGKWVQYVDPIASLVIAVILVAGTIPLVRNASLILLQGAPLGIEMEALKTEILKVNGVLAVHEFHVWQLAEGKSVASVHALIESPGCRDCHDRKKEGGISVDAATDAERPYMDIALDIKMLLHKYGIHSTTVQPEIVSRTEEACDNTSPDGNDSETSAVQRDNMSFKVF
ncbi:hypothetical protein PhCBS80983_g05935 [Powellomyces hirtus]|uniref:Cation efflux protein transmembrane domain-containing protein n=1 Tax=Powellomyces hirtus TaxID=109895 RepID=A0A507DTZ9_9FUNG|nr:hypothetical protein PhCBS80983_g05935 [Powellomyces hirtus]